MIKHILVYNHQTILFPSLTWICGIPGKVETSVRQGVIGTEPEVELVVGADDGAVGARQCGAAVPPVQVWSAAGTVMDLFIMNTKTDFDSGEKQRLVYFYFICIYGL